MDKLFSPLPIAYCCLLLKIKKGQPTPEQWAKDSSLMFLKIPLAVLHGVLWLCSYQLYVYSYSDSSVVCTVR